MTTHLSGHRFNYSEMENIYATALTQKANAKADLLTKYLI